MFGYVGLRNVQAGEVLNGFLSHHPHPRGDAGLGLALLGSYMAAVFEGRVHFLASVERPIYRMLGRAPNKKQTWNARPVR